MRADLPLQSPCTDRFFLDFSSEFVLCNEKASLVSLIKSAKSPEMTAVADSRSHVSWKATCKAVKTTISSIFTNKVEVFCDVFHTTIDGKFSIWREAKVWFASPTCLSSSPYQPDSSSVQNLVKQSLS